MKKLVLSKETLRNLNPPDLESIAGGRGWWLTIPEIMLDISVAFCTAGCTGGGCGTDTQDVACTLVGARDQK